MSVFQQFNIYAGLTPVRLVSTSNISGTYNNGPANNGVGATLTIAASSLTIDSVACNVGDRVLLQTQTNTNEQGIYVVNSIASTVVLQRAADQQSIEQMKAGQYVSVAAGSVNAGNFYSIIEPLPHVLGVDALTFNALPAAGAVSFSGGASTANALPVFSDTAGNIKAATTTVTLGQALSITGAFTATDAIQSTQGDVTAGSSGHAGKFVSFPGTASNGSFIFQALNNSGGFNSTLRNSNIGQATVYSLPDPGAATANILLDAGTNASGTFTVANIVNLKYGATPVAQVDPASCTISAAAGASNTATVTIQLKDGSGTNMARSIPFKVYASSASSGLVLATAASTGFSVASGGVLDPTGSTTITQGIAALSSATGGCVLSLLDTAKQTSYLVLVLANGVKISAQLTSGSYGA